MEVSLKPVRQPTTAAALEIDYVRRELRSLADDPARIGVYFGAVEAGDERVYRAFIEDPMRDYAPMLPDDILKQGEARWAETRDPALARRVQVLGEMLDNAKNAVSTAESVIRDLSGLLRDPVADALA